MMAFGTSKLFNTSWVGQERCGGIWERICNLQRCNSDLGLPTTTTQTELLVLLHSLASQYNCILLTIVNKIIWNYWNKIMTLQTKFTSMIAYMHKHIYTHIWKKLIRFHDMPHHHFVKEWYTNIQIQNRFLMTYSTQLWFDRCQIKITNIIIVIIWESENIKEKCL